MLKDKLKVSDQRPDDSKSSGRRVHLQRHQQSIAKRWIRLLRIVKEVWDHMLRAKSCRFQQQA